MDINETIKPEVYNKNSDITEDDDLEDFGDKEIEKFLDEEWIAQNGSDTCENCGYSTGRNHSCEA